ncbi:propanediol utilization protein [Antarctobacter heliothermus]|uniref:Threonine kinase n=1 Tax=Antarctobacter heliothermus TaxID=74033 RepID=A0A239INR9_9RHOB|nr:propanediol utilization protein [Antarctobacter heliothermus]SNS95215.1 threonine kinase [Antarctobacter heliothermus]
MQGRIGAGGPVVLVTLACPTRGVTVRRTGGGPLALEGAATVVTPAQAARMLAALGQPVAGRYHISADLQPGGGAGMSTAALVALARAARAAGATDGAAIARACLAVEGASDPLMWPTPDRLLWASRRAEIVRSLDPVPACEILGGFWGPPQRTDPKDADFPDIADLIEAWPQADLAAKAALAAESARRCSALRGPVDDPMPALATRLGALGHARAHTGPARALIFAPGTVPDGAARVLTAAGLKDVLRFATGGAV